MDKTVISSEEIMDKTAMLSKEIMDKAVETEKVSVLDDVTVCVTESSIPLKSNVEAALLEHDREAVAENRGTWGSQCEFLLSCIGYAIGLGNIWRFPYLCMRNGGGAFLIPYFIFLFLCGIPLFFLELSIGQFSSLGVMTIWKVAPIFKGLGYGMILVSGVVCIYYNIILAWCIYYLAHSFTWGTLPWATCGNSWNTASCKSRGVHAENGTTQNFTTSTTTTEEPQWTVNGTAVAITKVTTPAEEFWHRNVLELSDGIHDLGGIRWELFGCLAAAWFLVFICLSRGIKTSGKVVYVTATLPYLMMFVMLIRGLTLPGAMDGIRFYLTPDFSRLQHFSVWCEACAQIFYSLGPAYGSLITMASYNKFSHNCYRDSIIIPIVNCMTSFFCGFVVFSIMGFMAQQSGVPVSQVITSGPGLAFIVYPEVLSQLPLSHLWAVMFFVMLIIVGLDTQFGMFEALVSGFCDEMPRFLKGRKMLFTAFLAVVQFLLGLPIITRGGMYVFQIFDWYSATFALITISFLECVSLGWVYGGNRILEDMSLMFGRKPWFAWRILWQLVTPSLLMMVLIFSMMTFSPPSYGDYTYPPWAVGLGWCLACCSLVPIPLLALYAVLQKGKGNLWQRVCSVSRPAADWGPALKENRHGTKYSMN